jgi:Flp pilus assembly protein TadD
VGSYYLSDRNYQGAYLRFSEAARLDPANLEAIYGLAASADGLHKKDEAVANYRLYVEVAPKGERVRAAERALRSLGK